MPPRPPTAQYFKQIRTWEGKQTRAFEELCFQLRDPEPDGVELRKTSDPDGGLEWYWIYPDGSEEGWQCKFSDKERSLMSQMNDSFQSVQTRRPNARKLTFCLAVDLSDDPDGARGEFGWQRFEKLRKKWHELRPNLEVELILGGQILQRLTLDQHKGREWFWFGSSPVLDTDWCRVQTDVAIGSVRERYRRKINVDLPVATTTSAVALPRQLREHFDALVSAVAKQAADVLNHRIADGPLGPAFDNLEDQIQRIMRVARQPWTPQQTLDSGFADLLERGLAATEQVFDIAFMEANAASSEFDKAKTEQARHRLNRSYTHQRGARELQSCLSDLIEWTQGPASNAARSGFLFLDGEGGAGKTHLFCKVAEQLIDDGHPALLLLGQWFGGQSPWSTLAERIGAPQLSIDEVIGVLEASAEASGKRMVLLIDAINDADIDIWRRHLGELRARLTKSRWIGVALSCRTTYLVPLTPSGGFGPDITRATHPGFAGREFEAIERIFGAYGVPEPRTPLLLPEFTNPLFLILYCDSVSRGRVPTSGSAHLTAVFKAFVESRKADISSALGLDQGLDPVGKAIEALAEELSLRGGDHIPYEEANKIVGTFDTSTGRWPETLFGRMQSEGLITKDYAYLPDDYEGEAIRFPYQRFSDHLIVGGLLDKYLDPDDPKPSLMKGTLREMIEAGPLGALEALAIQLPERCGLELPDITAEIETPEWRKYSALKAFASSVPARDPKALEVTGVVRLLRLGVEEELIDEVTGALVACASIVEHPLNGYWFHKNLSKQAMPERDAGWMQMTYWAYGEIANPLDRLIRWAERGPYPDYDENILELSAFPIVWTLASPNRFARDAATKALSTLLVGRPQLSAKLVERFRDVDDPYVSERLAAAIYGALLRGQDEPSEIKHVKDLLGELLNLLECTRPNVLLRDHVAGVARFLRDRLGASAEDLVERALPPYGATPPEEPRSIEELERIFPSRGPDEKVGYGSIQHSLFTNFGDFNKYVMSGRVNNFQVQAIGSPLPPKGRRRHEQRYPDELAARYIFERVIELGWKPESFGDFDISIARADRGRDSHKPERFGKKYQWIGLFELLARLADNHALSRHWSEKHEEYEGAWQLSARDIDPSLPPARVRIVADERMRDPIFPPDDVDAWWVLPGPEFDRMGDHPGSWAERMDDLPPAESLFRRRDPDGLGWVVLGGRSQYEDDRDPLEEGSTPRRDLGFSVHTALVRLVDLGTLRRWFDARTDIMRSLPGWDAQAWSESYLGEVPWGGAAKVLDTGWTVDEFRQDAEFPEEALDVAIPWHWPSGFDCSLDQAVNVTIPSPALIRQGMLRREADGLAWLAGDNEVVRYVETDEGWDRDWALIAREDWLLDFLASESLAFVAGSYGERRVFEADSLSHEVLGWVDLGAGALLANGKWKLRGYDVIWDRRSGKDPD